MNVYEPPASPMLPGKPSQRFVILFFVLLSTLAVARGILFWYFPERPLELVTAVLVSSFALAWIYRDAKNHPVRIGPLLPLAVILVQPFAFFYWLVRTRNWYGLLAFMAYVGIVIAFLLLSQASFLLWGWAAGHSLEEMLK